MNTAQALADRLSPGTRFVYEANTYHDELDNSRFIGAEMVVIKGKWKKNVTVNGERNGFVLTVPQAAKAVEWLDADTVRYAIEGHREHTVTLRFPDPIDASGAS